MPDGGAGGMPSRKGWHMFSAALGLIIFLGGILAVSAWNHIRPQPQRKRFEPFPSKEPRFRDRIPEGYLTVTLWVMILALLGIGAKAWDLGTGDDPSRATPFIAAFAVGVAIFSLFSSFVSAINSASSLDQARLSSTAQMACYLTIENDALHLRFENTSSSASAYDVKASVGDEDTSQYTDPTRPYLGKGTPIFETPVFPSSRVFDIELSRISNEDVKRGLNITIHIEWTAFHDRAHASSFTLKSPVSFKKPT